MKAAANRLCCDGLCQQGRHCPAAGQAGADLWAPPLAPGVITGPYRAGRSHFVRWLRELLGRMGGAAR